MVHAFRTSLCGPWAKGFIIKAISFGGLLLLSVFPRGYPLIKLMIFSKNFSLLPPFIPRGKDDKMWSLVVSETEAVNSPELGKQMGCCFKHMAPCNVFLKKLPNPGLVMKGARIFLQRDKEISASFRWLTHCSYPELQDHTWHQYWEMLRWFPGPLLRKATTVPSSMEKEDDRF